MIHRRTFLGFAAALALAPSASAQLPAALTLDELFPDKPLSGKLARALAWSHDDRYVAYLWNPYHEKGTDLWVHDTKTGKTQRLTSLETFQAYDPEIPEQLARYKKDTEERERRKKLKEDERKKLEDEDKQKEKDRKTSLKEYPGVSDFAWAHKSDDLLLVYKGDLYRLTWGQGKLLRLTQTRDTEFDIRWGRDDDAYLFRRGEGLYRRRFDGTEERQLNPELPGGLSFGSYWLSEDEKTLLIQSGKRAGAASRQVSYLTYRERFAKAQTTERDVGDDQNQNEDYLFACELTDDPKNDNKPWEVYKKPVGEFHDLSLSEHPFSPDGKSFVFGAWRREKRELQIVVADLVNRKTKAIVTDSLNGEHRSGSLASPFYSPEGKTICYLSEKSGFRHAWLANPVLETTTQLTKGEFEAYPQAFSPDGKSLLVMANREDCSRADLYRVSVESGEIRRVTRQEGRHYDLALAHNTERYAANVATWKQLPELSVGSASDEKELTDSHSEGAFQKVARLTPRRFTYKNRLGMEVQGLLYVPSSYKKDDKRPLLIYVYGGPLGTDNAIRVGSFDRFGMYCAETLGYLYAIIDPRGTSGYGAVFGKANYEQPGVAQVEDLSDGVKYLAAQYGVDSKRVGVHGWSFGGFQTQMCLYTAADVFTLGIAGAGPTEWQNYNNWYVGGVIGTGKKAEELDKYSLTKLAKNLKSPLLLLHGLEDTNVLAQDTIHVYRELLKEGKGPLVELVLDPTGGHGLGGDINTKARFAIYSGFLERRWGKF